MSALMHAKARWTAGVMATLAALLASGASAAPIAFDRPELQAQGSLQVGVPGIAEGGALPANYAFAGRNLSPPVGWSEGPPKTRSFVLVMQDADAAAPGSEGVVHWLVYAIPPTALTLPRGMRNVASPSNPLGASQGRNSHDSLGYSGPNLSAGEPAHHYHLQVFALDRPLRLRAGADLPTVLRGMAGHVIARGELVATYAAPAPNAPHERQKGSPAPSAGSTPAEPGL